MKPNNKIKLKNATLSPVLSNGRDRGVCWNKGPVLSSRLSQGWLFLCTWSHQAQEKVHHHQGSKEESLIPSWRGMSSWERLAWAGRFKINKAGNKEEHIFTHCFSWAVSKPGKPELLDWMGVGRRFCSPGQRHQHNESTMTTGFMQNISPKAANTAQCSLITPQPAEKADEQRLQKTNLAGDGIFTLLSKQILFDSGHQVGNDRHWGVWTLGVFWIWKSKARLKTSLQSPATNWALHIPTEEGHWNQLLPPLNLTSMDHTEIKNSGQEKYLEARRRLSSDQRKLLSWPCGDKIHEDKSETGSNDGERIAASRIDLSYSGWKNRRKQPLPRGQNSAQRPNEQFLSHRGQPALGLKWAAQVICEN